LSIRDLFKKGGHVLEIYFQYVEIEIEYPPMFLEIRNIFPILTNKKPLCMGRGDLIVIRTFTIYGKPISDFYIR
jgi:hypothetical protein